VLPVAVWAPAITGHLLAFSDIGFLRLLGFVG
jgi:hypothetical protein